jgi:hypothetical protein
MHYVCFPHTLPQVIHHVTHTLPHVIHLVVSSYNTAGVWTWNTHDADWIYQVRQARV